MLTPVGSSALNSSFPDGPNSDMYGTEPQPTNTSPPGVVCAFPMTCATWPSGWSSELDQGGHPGGEVEPHRHHPAGAEQVAARLVVEDGVLAAADGLGVVLPGEDLPVAVEDLAGGGP